MWGGPGHAWPRRPGLLRGGAQRGGGAPNPNGFFGWGGGGTGQCSILTCMRFVCGCWRGCGWVRGVEDRLMCQAVVQSAGVQCPPLGGGGVAPELVHALSRVALVWGAGADVDSAAVVSDACVFQRCAPQAATASLGAASRSRARRGDSATPLGWRRPCAPACAPVGTTAQVRCCVAGLRCDCWWRAYPGVLSSCNCPSLGWGALIGRQLAGLCLCSSGGFTRELWPWPVGAGQLCTGLPSVWCC